MRRQVIRLLVIGAMFITVSDGHVVAAVDGCGYTCDQLNTFACIPDNVSHCNAIIFDVCQDYLNQWGPDCARACAVSVSYCEVGSPFNPCDNSSMSLAVCGFSPQ